MGANQGCCLNRAQKHKLGGFEIDLAESREWFAYAEQSLMLMQKECRWSSKLLQ